MLDSENTKPVKCLLVLSSSDSIYISAFVDLALDICTYLTDIFLGNTVFPS